MKRFSSLSASVLALSLALGGQAMAQTSHDQHHPGAADMRLAQATQMPGGGPMGQGAMGQGMGQGMMGDGMMQMMAGNCPMMGNMMGGGTPAFSGGRIAFLKAELAITDAPTRLLLRRTWMACRACASR